MFLVSGTKTGKAVQFVSDVILKEENGDRVDVKDVVVVITDGRAQDGEILSKASSNLRKRGALVSSSDPPYFPLIIEML